MTDSIFKTNLPFINKTKKETIPVTLLHHGQFKKWQGKQSNTVHNHIENQGFKAEPGQSLILHNQSGDVTKVIFAISASIKLYDGSVLVESLRKHLSEGMLKKAIFALDETDLKTEQIDKFCLGWALACYHFDKYKESAQALPNLLWPANATKVKIKQHIESVSLLRNMVNTPANDMGPDEMEKTAKALSTQHDAKFTVHDDQKELETHFPLVYAVGQASPRKPRVLEIHWGKETDPKLTLVGKGVCFDTGGLSLKTGNGMLYMKKDMAGAAHVLAVANMIMSQSMAVQLRVIIPVVDNDVSGGALRPGDIIKSRQGLTVEITNTDAEGRLILADALTAACEDNPDLVINFATLTGSKMAALGHDISAFLTNSNNNLEREVKLNSEQEEDPIWPFPLWSAYDHFINSSTADIINSAQRPGDVILAGLFLQKFIKPKTEWLHLDIYAWEMVGRPGRSKGATEQGFRAVLAYLESRYG